MPFDLFLGFVILIFSIIVHEVAHGYAANALGDPTARLSGRLTLNPFPHIDPVGSIILPALLLLGGSPIFFGWAKPVPYNPYNLKNQRWGEAIVAVAGSATNLALAIIFGLVYRWGAVAGFDATALSVAFAVAEVNLFLGMFNLIPFPPLDGFTFIRSALPWHLSRGLYNFERQMRNMGFVTLILFILVFWLVLADPFWNFVGWLFGLLTGSGVL